MFWMEKYVIPAIVFLRLYGIFELFEGIVWFTISLGIIQSPWE